MEEKKSRLNFDGVKVDKDPDFYRIMFSGQVGLQLNYLYTITEDTFSVRQIQHSRKRLVLGCLRNNKAEAGLELHFD